MTAIPRKSLRELVGDRPLPKRRPRVSDAARADRRGLAAIEMVRCLRQAMADDRPDARGVLRALAECWAADAINITKGE